MSDPAADRMYWSDAHRHFFKHLAVMPGSHKAVLLFAAVVAILGIIGQVITKAGGDARVHVTTPGTPTPAGSSGFVADGGSPGSTADAPQPVGTLTRLSPHATKIGLSIVLGFIIGWFFRAFLKTMALLAVIVGGGLWALSHFNIIHLSDANLEALKQHSASATSWLQEHAAHLKQLAVSHLPSAGGGAVGAFLGFRRK